MTFTKNKITIVALVCIAIIIAFLVNSGDKIDYITEPVTMGDIQKTVYGTGEVAAIDLVTIGAQVSGRIEKLNVVLGQNVKKGDLIAQIDSTFQQSELSTNKAKLKSYQAQLRSAKTAEAVAKHRYERDEKLAKKNYVSKAALEASERNYIEAQSKTTDLEAMIEQAEITIKTGKINLGYTTITAPFDGTIVSVPVKEGQTVNANQTTPTIVQMADLSSMAILIQISEGDMTKIKPGMKVTYSILSEPEEIYTAELVSKDPGLTTLTNGVYSGIIDANTAVYYYGRAIADNKDGKLNIGMTTQNEIIIASKSEVLKVPTLAIHEESGKKCVDILQNGKPVRREITTGISDSMYTEVLSGVAKGDLVISGQTIKSEIVNPVDIF